MILFLLRRLGHALLLLVLVSILAFAMTELAPGDYFDDLRLQEGSTPERLEQLRRQYGVDRSLPVRYGYWLRSVASGDLGRSVKYGAIAPQLAVRLRNSLYLSGVATLAAWLLALPLGLAIAASRRRWPKVLAGGATSMMLAVPELVIALALLMVAARTGWLPVGGMASLDFASLGPGEKVADLARHLALPATTLVLGLFPVLLRHIVSALLEVLDSPFLRAVRGFGIPRRRLLVRYALRAAANPLISLFGLSIAGLLSASLLVESIVNWPGLGPFLLEAISRRDVHVVITIIVLSTALLVVANLAADLMLWASDPRIRRE